MSLLIKTTFSRIINIVKTSAYKKSLNRNQFIFNYFIKQKVFQIKTIKKIHLPILGFGFGFGFSKKQKVIEEDTKMAEEKTILDDLKHNADQLFEENHYQETIDLLRKYSDQTNPSVQWRLARALFSIGKTITDRKHSDPMMIEAYELCKNALEQTDENPQIHKWYAILLDKRSEIISMKERMNQLVTIHKHMELAAKLNPYDPTSEYLLGQFSFGLADLPWYQKKIVSTIAKMPNDSTYASALEHFLKAEQLRANFYSSNLLMIGKCYLRLNDNPNAKIYLEKAFNYKQRNFDDKNAKEEAAQLLKKL